MCTWSVITCTHLCNDSHGFVSKKFCVTIADSLLEKKTSCDDDAQSEVQKTVYMRRQVLRFTKKSVEGPYACSRPQDMIMSATYVVAYMCLPSAYHPDRLVTKTSAMDSALLSLHTHLNSQETACVRGTTVD